MTREQVTEVFTEATKEQLKAILDINTFDIGTAKKDYETVLAEKDTLEKKLKEHEDTIANLEKATGDVETTKKELENLKAQLSTRDLAEKQAQQDKALTDNILAAFGDKAFTSDYVKNGLIADIKAQLSDTANAGKGVKDIFETLTKDKDGIFANQNPPPVMGGMGNTEKASDIDARAVMGLPPLK